MIEADAADEEIKEDEGMNFREPLQLRWGREALGIVTQHLSE